MHPYPLVAPKRPILDRLIVTAAHFLRKVNIRNINCVKSVQVLSFFWSIFSRIFYVVSIRIQFEYGKIRTRKNSVFEHFSRSD